MIDGLRVIIAPSDALLPVTADTCQLAIQDFWGWAVLLGLPLDAKLSSIGRPEAHPSADTQGHG